jgi:hypothetical protein
MRPGPGARMRAPAGPAHVRVPGRYMYRPACQRMGR